MEKYKLNVVYEDNNEYKRFYGWKEKYGKPVYWKDFEYGINKKYFIELYLDTNGKQTLVTNEKTLKKFFKKYKKDHRLFSNIPSIIVLYVKTYNQHLRKKDKHEELLPTIMMVYGHKGAGKTFVIECVKRILKYKVGKLSFLSHLFRKKIKHQSSDNISILNFIDVDSTPWPKKISRFSKLRHVVSSMSKHYLAWLIKFFLVSIGIALTAFGSELFGQKGFDLLEWVLFSVSSIALPLLWTIAYWINRSKIQFINLQELNLLSYFDQDIHNKKRSVISSIIDNQFINRKTFIFIEDYNAEQVIEVLDANVKRGDYVPLGINADNKVLKDDNLLLKKENYYIKSSSKNKAEKIDWNTFFSNREKDISEILIHKKYTGSNYAHSFKMELFSYTLNGYASPYQQFLNLLFILFLKEKHIIIDYRTVVDIFKSVDKSQGGKSEIEVYLNSLEVENKNVLHFLKKYYQSFTFNHSSRYVPSTKLESIEDITYNEYKTYSTSKWDYTFYIFLLKYFSEDYDYIKGMFSFFKRNYFKLLTPRGLFVGYPKRGERVNTITDIFDEIKDNDKKMKSFIKILVNNLIFFTWYNNQWDSESFGLFGKLQSLIEDNNMNNEIQNYEYNYTFVKRFKKLYFKSIEKEDIFMHKVYYNRFFNWKIDPYSGLSISQMFILEEEKEETLESIKDQVNKNLTNIENKENKKELVINIILFILNFVNTKVFTIDEYKYKIKPLISKEKEREKEREKENEIIKFEQALLWKEILKSNLFDPEINFISKEEEANIKIDNSEMKDMHFPYFMLNKIWFPHFNFNNHDDKQESTLNIYFTNESKEDLKWWKELKNKAIHHFENISLINPFLDDVNKIIDNGEYNNEKIIENLLIYPKLENDKDNECIKTLLEIKMNSNLDFSFLRVFKDKFGIDKIRSQTIKLNQSYLSYKNATFTNFFLTSDFVGKDIREALEQTSRIFSTNKTNKENDDTKTIDKLFEFILLLKEDIEKNFKDIIIDEYRKEPKNFEIEKLKEFVENIKYEQKINKDTNSEYLIIHLYVYIYRIYYEIIEEIEKTKTFSNEYIPETRKKLFESTIIHDSKENKILIDLKDIFNPLYKIHHNIEKKYEDELRITLIDLSNLDNTPTT